MSERIQQAFGKQEKILSVFTTAGFPRVNDTIPICRSLEAAGVDMIEIGIPFADPISDGPTIQASSVRALENGMSLERLFIDLRTLRPQVTIPVLLMGYLNPILQYGIERFADDASRVGIDGIIVPDLPKRDLDTKYGKVLSDNGIKVVTLITSRTAEERIRELDEVTTGFLYVVASEAVTGMRAGLSPLTRDFLERLSAMNLKNRAIVGFGIHDRQTYEGAIKFSAGAIVGSAFIRAIQELPGISISESDPQAMSKLVKTFVSSIRG